MPWASGYAFSALGDRLLGEAGRLRAEDERERLRQERESERQLDLAMQGVRSGTVPTRSRTIAAPIPEPGDFALPPLVPEPGQRELAGAAGMMRPPDLSPRLSSLSIEEPDPAFEQLTEGYYRPTPGYAEGRAFDAERTAFMNDVPSAINSLRNGGDVGQSAALLERYDIDPRDYIPPPDETPAWQAEAEFYANLRGPNGETYGPKGQLLPRAGSEDEQPDPTDVRQWYQEIRDTYSYQEPGPDGEMVWRDGLDQQTMLDMATSLAAGRDVVMPPLPGEGAMGRGVSARALTSQLMYNPSGRPPGFRSPGDRPLNVSRSTGVPEPTEVEMSEQQPDTTGASRLQPDTVDAGRQEPQELSDADVSQLKSMLSGMDRATAERILREEGATDDQIARVLGSG